MEASKDGAVTDDEYFTANESPDLFPQHNGTGERFVQAQLEHIPTETSQLILSHVPDTFSLGNLVLTNATFYHSFSAAQDLILNDVLLNEFSLRVLPDALATLLSGRISLHDHSTVETFLNKYQHSVSTAPEGWTLSDALELSRIRDEVEYFATDFASSLTSHPITGSPLERPLVLSNSELDRIRSALYRFELYCNCFRKSKEQPGTRSCERRRAFFDKFSQWEIEQLVTMYEYLFRKLSVAFDDVAQHDVEWGELSIPFYDNNHPPDNHHQEHYLSLGLGFLRRVAAARTYDERYQLLSPNFGSDSDFMWPALAEQDDDDGTGLILGDLTDEERQSILRPPFGNDPDKGPAKAWQWAHEKEVLPYVYFQLDQLHLRQRGYVMLDLQRLRKLGMFQEPFHFERKFDSEAFDARFEEMRESWMKRSKIWLDGGRGYWSAEGQSKIWYIYDKFGDWKVKSAPLEKSVISQPGEPLRYQNLAN